MATGSESAGGEDSVPTEAGNGELTAAERDARLRSLVVGLIPLAGVLVALLSLLWRRYLGQIGVRPVDIAVDAGSRVADVFVTLSVLVGLVGPQAFVSSWVSLLSDSTSPLGRWFSRHRRLSRIGLSVLTLVAAIALVLFNQLLFAILFGPLVAGLLLAKMFDLDDDLPPALRMSSVPPTRAIVGSLVIAALFVGLLSFEVVARGPTFDSNGETGWIAPDVLGFNAEPVQVTSVDDGSVTEVLYLGGNADLYVLVDPCDGDRVDYVSVGATRLTVIDQVSCDRSAS